MKILHIAPMNTAGVPINFVKAEREIGAYSRLIVLGANSQNREGDIYMNLPFLDSAFVAAIKRIVTPGHRRNIDCHAVPPDRIPKIWKPNAAEKLLIQMREALWKPSVAQVLEEVDFWSFDVYQLDGGLGFFRNSRILRRLKQLNKKIVVCYTGSDLRTRGVIPEIDAMADVRVTVEFDHLQYHPNIRYVPFPFDFSMLPQKARRDSGSLIIGHAPTNRRAKGSDIIINAVKELQQEYPHIELDLIEGVPYKEALERKSRCTLFIDQIGNLGYGINSIESLGMGIVTCSGLAPGFSSMFRGHPFIEIDRNSIKDNIRNIINNNEKRADLEERSASWVRSIHNSSTVVQKIHDMIYTQGLQ